ncbi:MAG: hypothetical protein C3F12_07440 [Candidatus Methylomirabilota bacterium]|nr:MAG: hypothetical protein C3F12_07440 [candidate division NC10 bacterium]
MRLSRKSVFLIGWKVPRAIARRSRSNLIVLEDNDGEITTLALDARNDEPVVGVVSRHTPMLMGAPSAHGVSQVYFQEGR